MPKNDSSINPKAISATIFAIGAYAALKTGDCKIVIQAYRKGGGGIKLCKAHELLMHPDQNPYIRLAAIDKHKYYDRSKGVEVDGWHAHFGSSGKKRNLHRTFNFPFGVEKANPPPKFV